MVNESKLRKLELEYMRQRTLSLLMTDSSSSYPNKRADQHSMPLGMVETENRFSIPSTPLLLAINIMRLWDKFKFDVLTVIQGLPSQKSNRPREIDWGRTIEATISKKKGRKKLKLKKKKKYIINKIDLKVVSFITWEYKTHINLLFDFFKTLETETPDSVNELLQVLKKIDELLSEHLESLKNRKGIDLYDIKEERLEHIEVLFLNLIKSKETRRKGIYDRYLRETKNILPLDNFSGICEIPIKWRSEYLGLTTGLGAGGDILVNHEKEIHHLFKLWCFHEIINYFSSSMRLDVAQSSFIVPDRRSALFSIESVGNVYYNFEGDSVSQEGELIKSKILRYSTVEWFIKLGQGTKIIIDTKYKDWDADDNLRALGYMEDFQADIGVVIFPRPFNKHNYIYNESPTDNIIIRELEGNKKFIALTLYPSSKKNETNNQTLGWFSKSVI